MSTVHDIKNPILGAICQIDDVIDISNAGIDNHPILKNNDNDQIQGQ